MSNGMSNAATVIQAASCAAEVVYQVGKESYTFIQSKYSCSKKLQDRYRMLNREVQTLQALTADHEADVEREKTKTTTSSYNLWRQRVSEIMEEIEKMKAIYERLRLPQWCILQRALLSKQMAKKCEEVRKLAEEGKFSDGFLVNKPPEIVIVEAECNRRILNASPENVIVEVEYNQRISNA